MRDFFLISGYVSHRYTSDAEKKDKKKKKKEKLGSWFIQTFVDVMQKYIAAVKSKLLFPRLYSSSSKNQPLFIPRANWGAAKTCKCVELQIMCWALNYNVQCSIPLAVGGSCSISFCLAAYDRKRVG